MIKKLVHIIISTIFIFSSCAYDPHNTKECGKRLNVLALFNTSLEEPWVKTINNALIKAKTELGINYWCFVYTEDMFIKKLEQHADSGKYDLIIGDAFKVEIRLREITSRYPNIKFLFGSGLGPSQPNLSVFDNWIHEPAFLAGMISGYMTKSNVIGAVAGYDIPECNRLLNAYYMGAKKVNQKIFFKVKYLNDWYDPINAEAMALDLIEKENVDIMFAERAGVITACDKKKIHSIGHLETNKIQPSEFVVATIMWDMWPTIKHVLKLVCSEEYYTAEDYREWSMMAKGGAYLDGEKWKKALNQEQKYEITAIEDNIKNGKFRVSINELPHIENN